MANKSHSWKPRGITDTTSTTVTIARSVTSCSERTHNEYLALEDKAAFMVALERLKEEKEETLPQGIS